MNCDAPELEAERARDRVRDERLRDAGHALEQHVAADEQRAEDPLDGRLLADGDLRHLGHDPVPEALHQRLILPDPRERRGRAASTSASVSARPEQRLGVVVGEAEPAGAATRNASSVDARRAAPSGARTASRASRRTGPTARRGACSARRPPRAPRRTRAAAARAPALRLGRAEAPAARDACRRAPPGRGRRGAASSESGRRREPACPCRSRGSSRRTRPAGCAGRRARGRTRRCRPCRGAGSGAARRRRAARPGRGRPPHGDEVSSRSQDRRRPAGPSRAVPRTTGQAVRPLGRSRRARASREATAPETDADARRSADDTRRSAASVLSSRPTGGSRRNTVAPAARQAPRAAGVRTCSTVCPARPSSSAQAASPCGDVAYDDERGPPGVPPVSVPSSRSTTLTATSSATTVSAIAPAPAHRRASASTRGQSGARRSTSSGAAAGRRRRPRRRRGRAGRSGRSRSARRASRVRSDGRRRDRPRPPEPQQPGAEAQPQRRLEIAAPLGLVGEPLELGRILGASPAARRQAPRASTSTRRRRELPRTERPHGEDGQRRGRSTDTPRPADPQRPSQSKAAAPTKVAEWRCQTTRRSRASGRGNARARGTAAPSRMLARLTRVARACAGFTASPGVQPRRRRPERRLALGRTPATARLGQSVAKPDPARDCQPGRRRPERRLSTRLHRLGMNAGAPAPPGARRRAARKQQEVESLLAHAQVDVEDRDERGRARRGDHASERRGERVQDEPSDRVARPGWRRRPPTTSPLQRERSRSETSRYPTTDDAERPPPGPATSARERPSARSPASFQRAAPGRRPRTRPRGRRRGSTQGAARARRGGT